MIDGGSGADARLVFDATAADYVAFVGTELSDGTEDAVDRSALAAFVELASAPGAPRPVADLGCGPGRVAAFLARQGVGSIGIDVSPELVRLGRDAHPGIPFAVAPIASLPLVDGSLDGAVCWYSIIYTPPAHLGGAFREIHRVVSPGGPLLLAFQAGPARPVRRDDAFGSGHPLTSHRHDPALVCAALEGSGFTIRTSTVRPATREHEVTPQAFVLAVARGGPDAASA